MMQFGLIGLGAGAAAALLFASVTSGAWLSIPLFYLAPLPIMIAGLGWSHWAAMIAALAGALALGIAFGPVFFFSFLAVAGAPAWWLGYLAMLARPAGNGAAALEWYPPGRLVVWAALLGGLVVIVAIPNFGLDARELPRRPARYADPSPARGNRYPGRRPARRAGRVQCHPAHRFPGGRHPAGGGGARHHHQRAQSVARRRDREVFRPAQAAVAGAGGHDLPARGDRGARDRHRPELCRQPRSASSRACSRQAC